MILLSEFKGMAYAGVALYGTALFTAVLLLGGIFSVSKVNNAKMTT